MDIGSLGDTKIILTWDTNTTYLKYKCAEEDCKKHPLTCHHSYCHSILMPSWLENELKTYEQADGVIPMIPEGKMPSLLGRPIHAFASPEEHTNHLKHFTTILYNVRVSMHIKVILLRSPMQISTNCIRYIVYINQTWHCNDLTRTNEGMHER